MKLGLGTWQLGGADFIDNKPIAWGEIKETEAIDLLLFALDSGIRFIDTADSYGQGQSERIIGKALSIYCPQDIHICTKIGNIRTSDGKNHQDFGPVYMKEAVYKSLDRLKKSKIETLLLHSPPDQTDWKNFDKSTLEDLISEGLIESYGVSSKSVYGAANVAKAGFGSYLEMIYNILDRRAEEVLFNLPEISTYKIIARVPYASGFLSPINLKSRTFKHDDYRSTLAERDHEWLMTSVQKLSWLEHDGGLSKTALKFVLEQPKVKFVIPGARRVDQIKNSLETLNTEPLTEEIKFKIKESVPDVPNWWKPAQ